VLDLLLASMDAKPRLPVECPERMDMVGGASCAAKLSLPQEDFYEWRGERPTSAGPVTRITAHTAISNATLRVREGQFFTAEVIERGAEFEGEIWCEMDPGGEAARWLTGEERLVTIGRGATRGQGWARLQVSFAQGHQPGEPERRKEGEQRLRDLNEVFKSDGKVVFTCTLLSPCVALDDWLNGRPYLTAADVEEAAGETGTLAGYELAAWYSRTETVSGWNSAAGLPKADTAAIAAGSAFVFQKNVAKQERENEFRRLAGIFCKVQRGIGERWEEGFGELEFCDEFHVRQRVL